MDILEMLYRKYTRHTTYACLISVTSKQNTRYSKALFFQQTFRLAAYSFRKCVLNELGFLKRSSVTVMVSEL
jgi:hypothetical protein